MIDKYGKRALVTVGTMVLIATAGCSYLNRKLGLPDDHPAEQVSEIVIEAAIKHNTGATVDIDLSHEDEMTYPEADE